MWSISCCLSWHRLCSSASLWLVKLSAVVLSQRETHKCSQTSGSASGHDGHNQEVRWCHHFPVGYGAHGIPNTLPLIVQMKHEPHLRWLLLSRLMLIWARLWWSHHVWCLYSHNPILVLVPSHNNNEQPQACVTDVILTDRCVSDTILNWKTHWNLDVNTSDILQPHVWQMSECFPHSFGFQLCKHLSISLSQSTTLSQNSCSQNGTRHSVAVSPVLDPLYIRF